MHYKIIMQIRVHGKKINIEKLEKEDKLFSILGQKIIEYGPPLEYETKQGRLFEYEGKTNKGERIEVDVLVSKVVPKTSTELAVVKHFHKEPETERIQALIDAKVFK